LVATDELQAEGSTLEEVFAAAAAAVGSLIAGQGDGEADRLPMLVESPDIGTLLGDFLDDLLYLSEIEHFAVERVERLELDGSSLRAAVSGRTGPTRSLALESFELEHEDDMWRLTIRAVIGPR
jgi:SHS2 domain-containing protein